MIIASTSIKTHRKVQSLPDLLDRAQRGERLAGEDALMCVAEVDVREDEADELWGQLEESRGCCGVCATIWVSGRGALITAAAAFIMMFSVVERITEGKVREECVCACVCVCVCVCV